MLPKVWHEEVCRGFDTANLNKELIRLKILIPGAWGKSTSSQRIAALGPDPKRLYHVLDSILEGDTD